MISKLIGRILNQNTRTKIWWMKLGIALLLSNIFFFVLFTGNEAPKVAQATPEGWVEIQIKAELLTPFHSGKKVLLLHRNSRKHLEAMLEKSPLEPEGRFTVLVKESQAQALLSYDSWEIIPFLKTLNFAPISKGAAHEIHY